MHVDALITDLDGTFWAPSMDIHPQSFAVVDKLDAAGAPFVIATGRRAQGALAGLAPAGLADRPAILMNGALARNKLAGESFLVDSIAPDDALSVFEMFDTIEPAAYIDHPETDMLIGPNSAHGSDYLKRAVGFSYVDDIPSEIQKHPVIGFGAFGFGYEVLEPIADRINTSRLATAIIGVSHFEGDYGIMIQGHAVDKQTGIEAWCARSGVDLSRLAVVGDGHNDIEMLRAAKIAIVPDNAPAEILAIADAIIAPSEEGGWKQIPEILGM